MNKIKYVIGTICRSGVLRDVWPNAAFAVLFAVIATLEIKMGRSPWYIFIDGMCAGFSLCAAMAIVIRIFYKQQRRDEFDEWCKQHVVQMLGAELKRHGLVGGVMVTSGDDSELEPPRKLNS